MATTVKEEAGCSGSTGSTMTSKGDTSFSTSRPSCKTDCLELNFPELGSSSNGNQACTGIASTCEHSLKLDKQIPSALAWSDPLRFGPLSRPSDEDLVKAAAFAEGGELLL